MVYSERSLSRLASLFSVTCAIGCGSVTAPTTPDAGNEGDGGGDANTETSRPRVVAMTPADGATKVSYLSPISLVFDESLDPASIDATTVRVRVRELYVPGTLAYDDASRTVLFTPARPLERGSRHHIELGDVKDLAGNTALPVDLEFSTYVNSLVLTKQLDAGGKVTGITKYLLDGNGRWAEVVPYRDPGQDGAWNSADDIASGRTSYGYRADGAQLSYRLYAGPGGDQTWNTADDAIDHVVTHTVDDDEHILTYADSIGAGGDASWGTGDDVLSMHEVRVWENGKNVEIVRYTSPGPDQTWRTSDDKSTDRVEVDYDDAGKKIRELGRSAGPDSTWNTADDTVYTYSTFSYDEHGYRLRTVRYYGAGPDTAWLTADDEVGGWLEERRTPAGLIEYGFAYNGPGPDAKWLTADDAGRSYGYAYDARGVPMAWALFDAGPDLRPGTADDVKMQHSRYTTDDQGRFVEIVNSIDTGNDGVWGTLDDVHDSHATFDLVH